jgi:hypothetical protein
MAKTAKPAHEAEADRLLRDRLLFGAFRVVERLAGDDAFLVELRPGYRLSMVYQVDGAVHRSLRLVVGPIDKPNKTAPSGT